MDPKIQSFIRSMFEFGRIEIRDVDGGQKPFLYSTKNHGPGYVDVKGGIGIDEFFEPAVELLAEIIVRDQVPVDVIVGMMSGGALPGYRLKQHLQARLGKRIVYIYQRGARKEGGHGELDTGDRNNPFVSDGCHVIIVEELVNFAGTTTNGVLYERTKGRVVDHAATILFYKNPVAIKRLETNNIALHWVITLPEVLDIGLSEGYITQSLFDQYLAFLRDPKSWNESRGYPFYG
jgi:orotate phosphoribosyltransferase